MVALGSGRNVWVAETAGPAGSAGSVGQAENDEKDLVLCVHGMSGAATNWTDFMGELAPDFDCAAVDLPGSGYSPPPRTRSGYSITAQAGVIIALIEVLTAARRRGGVHLVGNSMGGSVALRAAARRPDLVKTLTLISPALPDRPLRRLRRQTAHFPVIALPFVGDRLVRRYARIPAENRVAGVFETCYYDPAHLGADQFAREVADLRERDKLGYDPDVIVGAARTLVGETLRPHRFSLWSAAERVTIPALVMFGSHDQLVSPQLAAIAARAFPDARVLVLPLTGHIAQMERPALVAAQFREMVARTRTRTGDGFPRGNSGHRDSVDA
jgi:pimeloyl-ACP methyl ester carboxylesterase